MYAPSLPAVQGLQLPIAIEEAAIACSAARSYVLPLEVPNTVPAMHTRSPPFFWSLQRPS
jgi:hypothetical protein